MSGTSKTINLGGQVLFESNQFKGVALTSTNPGSPNDPEYWFAGEAGTYTHFNGLVVSGQVAFLIWNGSAWSKYETGISLVDYMQLSAFTEIGKNKFNPDECIEGAYFNNSNGALNLGAGSVFNCSGYQAVLPNTEYTLTKFGTDATYGNIRFYNSSMANLGGYDGDYRTITFTTPSGCAFIGINSMANPTESFSLFKTLFQLELGAVSSTQVPYTRLLKKSLTQKLDDAVSTGDIPTIKAETLALAKAEAIALDEILKKIVSTKLPLNANKGNGTLYPSFTWTTGGQNLTGTHVTNTSPCSAQLPYMNRLTAISNSGSTFVEWDGTVGYVFPTSPKPTKWSWGFWLNDTQLATVFAGSPNMMFYFFDGSIYATILIAINTVIAAIGNEQNGTFNVASYMAGDFKAVCLDKQDGWSFVAFTVENVVYDGAFTSTTPRFYMNYPQVALLYGNDLDYANFTFVWEDEIICSNIHPDGLNVMQYPPSISDAVDVAQQAMVIANEAKIGIKKTTVIIATPYVHVFTPYNDTYDLRTDFTCFNSTPFNNNIVNFSSHLVIKGSNNICAPTITLQSGADDGTPTSMNGTYIGGNHGCSSGILITASSHGKTAVDVGSEWTDSANRKFYILRIVSSSMLWVLSENIGASDIWAFDLLSGSSLTHSAGATHTGTITFSAQEQAQITPAIKNRTCKVLLDGIAEETADGTYYCDHVDIKENYEIVNPASAIDYLIANRGTDPSPAINAGDGCVQCNIVFRMQNNGAMLVLHDWTALQKVDIGYMGFIQNAPMNTVSPLTKMLVYMPKALPVTVSGTTYDLRTLIDLTSAPAGSINIDSAYWENPNSPPDRAIEFLALGDGTRKHAFMSGFVTDKGIGVGRKDLVSRAWYYYTSRKSYPCGIDDTLGDIAAGTTYQAVAFRIFSDVENNPTGRLSCNMIEVGKAVYIYLDYNGVMIDNVAIPNKYVGMDITVVEKSSNVTISNATVASDNLRVTVATASPLYGYAVLKLT